MPISVRCHCACNEEPPTSSGVTPLEGPPHASAAEIAFSEKTPCGGLEPPPSDPAEEASSRKLRPRPPKERGLTVFAAELQLPLMGEPVRVGEVLHLQHEDSTLLEPATLTLYANGFMIAPLENSSSVQRLSWSPFSLVQACRLHSEQADASLPWLRIFKISLFHHGLAYFFATRGDHADADRAGWVADIARAIRALTQSLFPPFQLRVDPVQGAGWTDSRLLAGYMILCDSQSVSLVYCELHTHWDFESTFALYEDECCDVVVMYLRIGVETRISERVGVDCSSFGIDGHHFSTRTSAEKSFWLRAISNVKVKLRHRTENPSAEALQHYRAAVREGAQGIRVPTASPPVALLPRKQHHSPSNQPKRAGSGAFGSTGGPEEPGRSKGGRSHHSNGASSPPLEAPPTPPRPPPRSGEHEVMQLLGGSNGLTHI